MLHYTPLQQRGESQSPYSLANFLTYDSGLFEPGWKGTEKDGVNKIRETLSTAKKEFGLLSLTDVVLNHTANNSEWLLDHPEAGASSSLCTRYSFLKEFLFAGFSPFNSPHLTPAFELDTAMLSFSKSLAAKNLPVKVTSSKDVDTLLDAFHDELKALNLWQYYVLDVAKEKESVKNALATAPEWQGPVVERKTVVELAEIIRSTGALDDSKKFHARFTLTVKPETAASLIKAAFTELSSEDAFADAWVRVVDVLNVPLYQEWEADTRAALDSIKNRVNYTRLAEHGPKLGEITEE